MCRTQRLASTVLVLVVFALALFSAGIKPSSANQKSASTPRYEYRILKERGFGEALEPQRTRNPFEVVEPPKDLEEILNKLGRDGWEVVDLRIRRAQPELKAKRQAPGYYLYSEAGENAPRFLRLRRRVE